MFLYFPSALKANRLLKFAYTKNKNQKNPIPKKRRSLRASVSEEQDLTRLNTTNNSCLHKATGQESSYPVVLNLYSCRANFITYFFKSTLACRVKHDKEFSKLYGTACRRPSLHVSAPVTQSVQNYLLCRGVQHTLRSFSNENPSKYMPLRSRKRLEKQIAANRFSCAPAVGTPLARSYIQ